jgi:transcriptional regulator with XRE-family HTH domain
MGRLTSRRPPPTASFRWPVGGSSAPGVVGSRLSSPHNLTTNGLSCQPLKVSRLDQNRFVEKSQFTPKAVLRQNLKALMAKAGAPGRPEAQLALSSRSGVAQATIGRILESGGENARIETVHKLAKAYGLEGWQLLVSGMDPANPPVLQPISKSERALYEKLKELSKDFGSIK